MITVRDSEAILVGIVSHGLSSCGDGTIGAMTSIAQLNAWINVITGLGVED